MTADSRAQANAGGTPALFDEAVAAALRAVYGGLSSREAVQRYLPGRLQGGRSARGVIGQVRRELASYARSRFREDLALLLEQPRRGSKFDGRALQAALDELRAAPLPTPMLGDEIQRWLPQRAVRALQATGIRTLADLTVRIPRRRQWWLGIPDLGEASARQIEAFFAEHPDLTARARALIARDAQGAIVPLERQRPHELDGSHGQYRAPQAQCLLSARNDLEAVNAWLQLHEADATRRAYRKEAERLMLWAVFERGKPLSSLNTEDATAYRAFLRDPHPTSRWVGPARPRTSPEWRPFAGPLSAQSIAYSLSVLAAMFRWLVAQHYVLANPFAGLKVRGAQARKPLDSSRCFTQGEWGLLRTVADGLEISYGWERPAAERLRFILDFSYATGLRASELVTLQLRSFRPDPDGNLWIHVLGKGAKKGTVAVPPLASSALERYLRQRGLPSTRETWRPQTPVVGNLTEDGGAITAARLWAVMRRFFATAASVIGADAPELPAKLQAASPHWMRHTHATHALATGAELTTVRDNLRHASISTTTTYLHGEDRKRARQLANAFTIAS